MARMIGNSVKGRGFRGCLNYNLNPDKDAQVIGGNMEGVTARSLATEFGEVRRLNQRVKTPCWHVSLSAVPGEKLNDSQWSQVADRYLDHMGFDRSQHQYVVVRHYDTRHQHVHIVANRVALDGSVNYLKWHLKDTKKATRQLEQDLPYLQSTCLEQTKASLEAAYQQPAAELQRREPIKGQYQRHRRESAQSIAPQPIMQQRLQEAVGRVLPQSQNVEDFITRLAAEGIEARIRVRRARQVGISYRLDGVALRGTTLGADYRWSSIQQHFEQRKSVSFIETQGGQDGAERTVEKNPARRTGIDDPPQRTAQAESEYPADAQISTGPDRTSAATRAEDADRRERFAELGTLAADFAGLVESTETLRDTTDEHRGSTPRIEPTGDDGRHQRSSAGDLASSTSDDREPDQYHEPDSAAVPEHRVAAAELNDPGQRFRETDASLSAGDEPRVEPTGADDSGVSESVDSSTDVAEWETVEREDAVWDAGSHRHNPSSDSASTGDAGNELAASIDTGADEQPDEQPGTQPAENSEAAQIEIQRLLAIAQGWSDEQLLMVEKGVAAYFNRQPRQPDLDEGKALIGEIQRLQGVIQQTAEQYEEQKEFVEFLGPARSLRHPFGAPPKEVEAAQSRLEKIRRQWMSLKRNLKEAERQFEAWRQPAALYREWRFGDTGEKMHECQKILQLDSVQERIVGIREAQERREMLEKLQQWEAIAQKLGHAKNYVDRVRVIAEEYRQGFPLSEPARQAFQRDLEAHQQVQRRLQRRFPNLSL